MLTAVGLAMGASVATGASGDPAPFDLQGPTIQVTVTRGDKTLPIAQTPNLAEGDKLSIKADLPKSQSAHYLLVAGFLRGVTNPPPEKWFFPSQTWKPKAKDGLTITVPAGAQQMLLFLAPETSGDFKTLVDAVRGRPGAFVQATQNLNQASLDHGRLQAFLTAVRAINRARPAELKAASSLLARSLSIKLDAACLQQTTEQQASCLTQGQDHLVLSDGHSTSMVQALTSGYSADLVQALSVTPQAGGGFYSPYVSSVLALAHLLDSFRTAQFRYLPALETQADDRLSLLLNAAPSFQNPKSVLVVAMPGVEPSQPPPLRAIETATGTCLQNPALVLPVEGAPLVFSTAYAHDMVLRLQGKGGRVVEAPVKAEAEKGGLVVDTSRLDPALFDHTVEGRIEGFWGFEPYSGPSVQLQSAGDETWRVDADDAQALIAGRDGTVRLHAQASGCVQNVSLQSASGAAREVKWKTSGPDTLVINAALKDAQPGPMTLLIQRYGSQTPDAVSVRVYAASSHLQAFAFHAGDRSGVLKGASRDEVSQLELNGVVFRPDVAAPEGAGGGLIMAAVDADAAARLKAGQGGKARVRLRDGQVVTLAATVAPPRPDVGLIAKSVQPAASDARVRIVLGDPNALPHDAQLSFSVQANGATAFSAADAIEVATAQGDVSTTLTAANGGLTLQNAQVAVGRLDLGKALGPSAFGPLRFRLVNAAGASDWKPLGVLVRLPILHDLTCQTSPDQPEPCQLSGSNLFLIDSLSSGRAFGDAVQTPPGFPGNTLPAPQPSGGQLYMKLSDDPAAISVVLVPPVGRSASRASASTSQQP